MQPSPLPFGRGRATPPLKLPNVIKKKKKKRTAGKSKSNGADYDDDDDDDDEDEVEVALDPTAERARLEQEGKPLPPLPEEDEERSHVGEDATTALNTTNELLKAPAEENIERRGEHGRGGEAKMSRSKAGPPSTLAFKGVTGIEHTAGTAAPESSSSLDAASLSSNSTNAKQQQTAASSAPPAPPLSRSVTELGAGQLMDALLRGTKGTSAHVAPSTPPPPCPFIGHMFTRETFDCVIFDCPLHCTEKLYYFACDRTREPSIDLIVKVCIICISY